MPSTQKPRTQSRLGRGLSSLISSSTEPSDADQQYVGQPSEPSPAAKTTIAAGTDGHTDLAIDAIAPNPYQPRRDFDEADLANLAASIQRQGVLQPIIVTLATEPDADKPYILVAGERRLRAAEQAGLRAIPCIIRQAERQEMLEWAIVENIHRSDLNPIERAEAYRQYLDRFNVSQTDAAERLGQPRTTIANHLRLLELCDEVQRLMASGALSFGHGKVLAGLIDRPGIQAELARRAATEGMSVRRIEKLVAAALKRPEPTGGARPTAVAKAPYIRDLEERLAGAVGSRVTILPGRARHSGRIVIEYYSLDDFDRITATLGIESAE